MLGWDGHRCVPPCFVTNRGRAAALAGLVRYFMILAKSGKRRRRKTMGPLAGLRIVEMAGIGPAPFCGMLLADLGAEVIRVDRLAAADLGFDIDRRFDFLNRSKRAVAVDLKSAEGVALVKDLIASADALI